MSRANVAGMTSVVSLNEAILDSFVESNKTQDVKQLIQLLLGQLNDTNNNPYVAPQSSIQRIITLALQVLETSEFDQQTREAIAKDNILSILFLGFYAIYTSASHRRIDPKVMAEDLRRMGLTRKDIQDIVEPFVEKKDIIEALARQNRINNPSIERLEWRVDVAVTSSQLNRVFKPIILFQITTSSGDIKTFECSMEKFHLLRYSVARMLAAVQNIEQNPTLTRLVD